jgi:DNA-binding NarL/FixJ family response regulator
MEQLTVLIVATDQALSHVVETTLAAWGMRTTRLTEPQGVLDAVQAYGVHLVLLELGLPGRGGLNVLTRLRTHASHLPVLGMVTDAATACARAVLQGGAWGLVDPSRAPDLLVHTIYQALRMQQLEAANHTLQTELHRTHEALDTARAQMEALQQTLREAHQAVMICARHLAQTRQESDVHFYSQAHALLQPLRRRLLGTGEMMTAGLSADSVHAEGETSSAQMPPHWTVRARLSATEVRVALLIQAGMKNADIAVRLYISPETVKTHRKNIRKKLGLRSSSMNLYAYLQSLDNHA